MKKLVMLIMILFAFGIVAKADAYLIGSSSRDNDSGDKSNSRGGSNWHGSNWGDTSWGKSSYFDSFKGKTSYDKHLPDKYKWDFPKWDKDWCQKPPDCPPVPEPATMILLGTGLVGLAGVGRKFKKRT